MFETTNQQLTKNQTHIWLVNFLRDSVAPVTKFLKVPSGGPPVPARREVGSFDKGQPNLALNKRLRWRPMENPYPFFGDDGKLLLDWLVGLLFFLEILSPKKKRSLYHLVRKLLSLRWHNSICYS